MKAPLALVLLMASSIVAATAQTAPSPVPAPANSGAAAPADATAPEAPPAPPPPLADAPGTTLMLRGLDKITGRPTNIAAPIGKPVQFATLTITARYCYSTPASETPETSAFVQIDDHRPDQRDRRAHV